MNIEILREYCIRKKGVTEEFPFGEETLVFKVKGKAFALTGLDERPLKVNLKCEPEKAIQLREDFEEILPGWHMNKKHWNTVYLEGALSDKFVFDLIDHSYSEVIKGLPKKLQAELDLSIK